MTSETKSNASTDTRHEHQVLTGRVTSAKMEKTIVVEVLRLVQHAKYRRVVRISKKFSAHDEKRPDKPGDPAGGSTQNTAAWGVSRKSFTPMMKSATPSRGTRCASWRRVRFPS